MYWCRNPQFNLIHLFFSSSNISFLLHFFFCTLYVYVYVYVHVYIKLFFFFIRLEFVLSWTCYIKLNCIVYTCILNYFFFSCQRFNIVYWFFYLFKTILKFFMHEINSNIIFIINFFFFLKCIVMMKCKFISRHFYSINLLTIGILLCYLMTLTKKKKKNSKKWTKFINLNNKIFVFEISKWKKKQN